MGALERRTHAGALRRHGCAGKATLALTALAALSPVLGQPTGEVPFSPPEDAVPEDFDIAVIISPDSGCMTRQEELLLLDGGCYSNSYSNLTKAFQLKITSYGHGGVPWMVDLTEYEDNCKTPSYDPPTRTLEMGKCERFAGAVRATIGPKHRSVRCKGIDCSKMPVGVQEFFEQANCQGRVMTELSQRVALNGDCLRWRNGTQTFVVDNIMDNITRIDYPNSTSCAWDGVAPRTEYQIKDDCFELYPDSAPRSFRWRVSRVGSVLSTVSAATGAPVLHGAAAALLWLAAACRGS